jgi:hypothetical protein
MTVGVSPPGVVTVRKDSKLFRHQNVFRQISEQGINLLLGEEGVDYVCFFLRSWQPNYKHGISFEICRVCHQPFHKSAWVSGN